MIIHSISFSGEGNATVSSVVTPDEVAFMKKSFDKPIQAKELVRPIDLFAQALNRQESKFRGYMAAWTALEQFIKSTKRYYGDLWLDERNETGTSAARILELDSIPNKNSKLARAFGKMARILAPTDADKDIAEFDRLRNMRNDINHELKDAELPTDSVLAFLDRYLDLHIRYLPKAR
jgi:hypothetical protein